MNAEKMREELRVYIARHHIKQSSYAEKLGVSSAFVSAVVTGLKPPSTEMLNDLGLRRERTVKYEYFKK